MRDEMNQISKESELKEMIGDIWNVARKFNSSNFISGHLSFTKSFYAVQLLEGVDDVVNSLMERIRKDKRVIIEREFKKKILTMSGGWELSMCYSFNLTATDLGMIKNPNVSLNQLFESITGTYEVKRQGLQLSKFYRNAVDIVLFKYISLDKQDLINVEICKKYPSHQSF